MPIPTSGAFSFADLRNEFGGGNPVYISNFYRNGPLVPNVGANGNVPTGGIYYLSTLRGATKSTPLTASAPPINARNLPNGSASRSSTVSASGGTGSYSLTAATVGSGAASVSRNGMQITVSASGTNTERNGTINYTVSDGQSSYNGSFSFSFQFGTPI